MLIRKYFRTGHWYGLSIIEKLNLRDVALCGILLWRQWKRCIM